MTFAARTARRILCGLGCLCLAAGLVACGHDGNSDGSSEKKTEAREHSGGTGNRGTWLLHAPIPVEQGIGLFAFLGGDYDGDGNRDLFAIKTKDTGTHSTEVHVLNGQHSFQDFLLQTGTPLELSSNVYSFALGDWNQDGCPDLYAIKLAGTPSGHAELHILDGKSKYQQFLLHTPLPVEAAYGTFAFATGDYNGDGMPDLYAVKTRDTDSKQTEMHIMDGKTNCQSFLLQAPTALELSYGNFAFAMSDFNEDGAPDLYAIKTQGTGTKSTEIHVLDGQSKFQRFLLHTGTRLEEARGNFSFDVGSYQKDKANDIYAIKVWNTDSGKSEVHILGGIGGIADYDETI